MNDEQFIRGRKVNDNVTEFTLPRPIIAKRGELIQNTVRIKDGEVWLRIDHKFNPTP